MKDNKKKKDRRKYPQGSAASHAGQNSGNHGGHAGHPRSRSSKLLKNRMYQREFFYSAFYTGLGTMLLWMLRHKDSTVDPSSSRLTTYVFLAIVAILMVLGLVMLLQARKNGGVWSLAGREVRVLPAEAGYSLIFLTLAVNVVAVAAAAVMGGNVGYYLIYVLVAWLFALLVYYTVKMM